MRISDWSSDVCSSDLDVVVNRKGTTWRKLDEATRNGLHANNAAKLLASQPSLVKRPVIASPDGLSVGFAKADEQAIVDRLRHSRSEERRVGKECVSTCRPRWSAYP